MPHILYSFRRCPFAMRARMALIVAGIEYEHREIILRDKPVSMIAASPKATVPVFIKSSGQVIDESIEIMLWALGENDPYRWIEGDLHAMLALAAQTQSDFKPHLDRYKYVSRYKVEAARGELDLDHRAKAEEFVAQLETRLTQNTYLFSHTPRIADYAIFPFLRQFANTDREWWDRSNYPKVRVWLEGFLGGDLFGSCMQKHELWQDN